MHPRTATARDRLASLARFIDRLGDLQPIAIRILEHILPRIPRPVRDLLDDLRAALTMLREHRVDILNPQKNVRVQIAALQQRGHARIVRHVEQHTISLHSRVNRRLAKNKVLFEAQHAAVVIDRRTHVRGRDNRNRIFEFHRHMESGGALPQSTRFAAKCERFIAPRMAAGNFRATPRDQAAHAPPCTLSHAVVSF